MKHVLVVTGAESELALAGFLATRLGLETADAETWVRGGSVYVDGRRQRQPALRIRPGQRVIAHTLVEGASRVVLEARVVYRDHDLAVVDKPAGLASMPLRQGGDSLEDQLPRLLGREARLLHRLDRETSGLLLCSMATASRPALAEVVAGHHMLRCYLAIVDGDPGEPELVIRSRLSLHRGHAASSQDPRAREAVSRVRLVRRLGGRALVEAQLETGRTHQLRAHLSEARLPILGDGRYGGPAAPRLALHAHRLRLVGGGGWVDLHSPMPTDMRALLEG